MKKIECIYKTNGQCPCNYTFTVCDHSCIGYFRTCRNYFRCSISKTGEILFNKIAKYFLGGLIGAIAGFLLLCIIAGCIAAASNN